MISERVFIAQAEAETSYEQERKKKRCAIDKRDNCQKEVLDGCENCRHYR